MSTNESTFKNTHDFEKRKDESSRLLSKYPDRIPIIVAKEKTSDIPDLDKYKFLVPRDLTVGQFIFVIRKRLKLKSEIGMFIFVENTLPPVSYPISQLYKDHEDIDGFLYVTYSGESTFG